MSARRLTLRMLVSLCVLTGALLVWSAPALAAPPEAPVTGGASAVAATSATLNGELNPKAAGEPGEYEFLYMVSATECAGGATAPVPAGMAMGFEKEAVSVEVSGLEPSAQYTFCVLARNPVGETTVGSPVSFTTSPAPPTVDAESASGVNSTGATLEAQVNPDNQETTFSFEYSTQANGEVLEGTITTVNGENPLAAEFGDRTATVPRLEGLLPGTTYFYRVVATDATGTTNGTVQSFTTVPTPNTDPVSAIAATTATFNGHLTLDPVDTTYSFDYNTGGECTGGSATPTADAGAGAGNAAQATEVTGLLPHMLYTVCFVTSNAFGSELGSPVSFTTLVAPPAIESESVANVSGGSADLIAQVNPGGGETTYHFDYGTTESYGQSTTESPSIGSDDIGHPILVHIQGLRAATVYHYRIVASNSQSPAGGTPGPDQTFRTQPAGGELTLLDGRQWELVSPPVKNGARIWPAVGAFGEGGVAQAAEDGSAVTYLASAPIETPAGNAAQSQIFSSRGASGWSSRDIAAPYAEAVYPSIGQGQEYKFFSSDLSLGIVQQLLGTDGGEGLLSPEASEYTAYLHNNADDGSTGFLPLVTAANVPPGTEFGGPPNARVTFIDGSPDLSHIVIKAFAALTSTPTENGLYEWAAGRLQLISILPDGEAAPNPELGEAYSGGAFRNARGAISGDGSRTFWESFVEGEVGLYLRDVRKGETVRVDAVRGGSGAGGAAPLFELGSGDGSRVFFTDTQRLTADAPPTAEESPDLYECHIVEEAGGRLACDLTDLTVDEHAGEGAGAGLVLGASEDGSYVYFMASGALAAGASPSPCGCNLYVRHGGRTRYIASILQPGFSNEFLVRYLTPRVSPNGRYLTFMSDRTLMGYDNHDVSSGVADNEVYLYDAESNRLVCASCNPTGARPMGPSQISIMPGLRFSDGRYQPRDLSDSGRLFFDSADALVPQDTDGTTDVYEFEPAGVGDCRTTSLTFSEASGGCVGLISSGSSPEESTFLDASADGGDVFFVTVARLVAQDFDTGYDVYDAHVCSAAVPCAPPVVSPPACTSADSCRAAPSPQPGVFGAPATATFSGAGNAVASVARPVVKPKSKRKRKAKHRHTKHRHKQRGQRGSARKSTATKSLSVMTRR